MALEPLADAAVLDLKGVDLDTVNSGLVDLMLNAASWIIRDAAGHIITQVTSTISIPAPEGIWLPLPGPVASVTSVLVDGAAVDDWKLIGGRLWRRHGWRPRCEPVEAQVTLTHGYVEVPADIVNLCADLAKVGIQTASQEAIPANVVAVSYTIDDYTERLQYSNEARTAMELPDVTKAWLAQRFGSGVYVTSELK